MNTHQNYQSLVEKYKSAAKFIKKLELLRMFIQIGIIVFISIWKRLGVGQYQIAAPILLSLSIYFLVKDFFTLRKNEENMAQIILDGVKLEIKNVTLGKFFQGFLQSFNLTNILLRRALVNVLVLGCIGYLIFRFISDINPGLTISRVFLSLFTCIPSIIASKLYYDSFKALDEAKARVITK